MLACQGGEGGGTKLLKIQVSEWFMKRKQPRIWKNGARSANVDIDLIKLDAKMLPM